MTTNQSPEPFNPANHSLAVFIEYGPHEEDLSPKPHWFFGDQELTHQELLSNNEELIAWGVGHSDSPVRERIYANGGRIQYGYCATKHVLLAFEGNAREYFVETQEL